MIGDSTMSLDAAAVINSSSLRSLNEDDSWYLGKPVLRVWELNENSTRYDVIVAGPSDEDLHRFWWIWAVVALLVGTSSLILFLGIANSKKAMKNPFNIYLMYLAIPDFVFSLCCGITCLLNAINGQYWAPWMCIFQQWYCVFGIGSNAWLNGCITWELYKMLKFSNIRKRYKSPSRRFVSMQAVTVYLSMGFLGTWGAFDAPHWPVHAGATGGLACLPIETDKVSSIFFWLAFFPLFAGIPSVYITYVSYMVWRRALLPPTGKRRLLTIYFGRLILVFYVMWIPTLLLLFAFSSFVTPWVHFLGGLWSHLQGLVSMAVSLMKPDVYKATINFMTCHCGRGEQEESSKNRRPTHQSSPTTSVRPSQLRNSILGGSGPWSDWFSLLSQRAFKPSEPSGHMTMMTPPGDTESPGFTENPTPSVQFGAPKTNHPNTNLATSMLTSSHRSSAFGSQELWPSSRSIPHMSNSRVESLAAGDEQPTNSSNFTTEGVSEVLHENIMEDHVDEGPGDPLSGDGELLVDQDDDDDGQDEFEGSQHETIEYA